MKKQDALNELSKVEADVSKEQARIADAAQDRRCAGKG